MIKKRAYYDDYDYPMYWEGRDYEHQSEVLAISKFLNRIPKINKILDIGAGYGRLTPHYAFRAKKVFLAEPSKHLIEKAKLRLQKFKNVDFVQSTVEELPKNFKPKQFDLIMMIRVMHHILNPDEAIKTLSQMVKPEGYLILEFANKIHGKATLAKMMKGDFTFPMDIFPADHKKKNKRGDIAFYNYHPHIIKDLLKKHGFKILEVRSVSNIRSPYAKKHVPIEWLISIERLLQQPLVSIYFGPSIFILAKRKS